MEQDRKYLLQKIAEAIYPELNILSDKKGLGDLECRAFEDMELSFYVNDGCGEKLYILEKIQQILGDLESIWWRLLLLIINEMQNFRFMRKIFA